MTNLTIALLPLLGLAATSALGATYYVSNGGSDEADGKSPPTAWRTLARVNAQAFAPGDSILLRRGDRWREQLLPKSGSEAGHVTYGAYGQGPKPLLLGSLSMSRPEQWTHEGGNLWSTRGPKGVGQPVLEEGALPWGLFCENGARAVGAKDTADFDSAPESYRVECFASGKGGSDIQLSLSPFPVELGKTYRLTFRAKCTRPFPLRLPTLMKQGPPWTSYTGGAQPPASEMGPDWRTVTHYYRVSANAADGRLTVYLGGVLPEGAVLNIDSLRLERCDAGDLLYADVGNTIFNGGESCGMKKWTAADLKAQGDFWYDPHEQRVVLYSAEAPTTHYRDIECALCVHQINESNTSYVTYENLALLYGGAHGIGGGNTHHIIVRDCDFGFIGGGDQYGGGEKRVRFGNGIEFWGSAHDNLVERCRLWEVYDAALTNQNAGAVAEEVNITYRQNVIWNCEYSFEYWNAPANSVTRNIQFMNNTCVNAGHGWGHAQRPDPSGRHLCFYDSPARAEGLIIRNNIFFEATKNAFYAPGWTPEALASLTLDHNLWYQAEGDMIAFKGRSYTQAQFPEYQQKEGKDAESIVADPLFANLAGHDFHLKADSPCLGAGADPQGKAPDIGAYEE